MTDTRISAISWILGALTMVVTLFTAFTPSMAQAATFSIVKQSQSQRSWRYVERGSWTFVE
jgi:hypothetical protein